MTAVLTLGAFTQSSFFPTGGGFVAFDPDTPGTTVERLGDLVFEGIQAYGPVIAVIPTWRLEPALRMVATVRSLLGSIELVPVVSNLPPLALSVLASEMAALGAHDVPAGALVAAVPLLEEGLLVAAWLPSVAGLSNPSPSLTQHMRSWLPGSAFLAVPGPRPTLRRIHQSELPTDLSLPTLAQPAIVAISGGGADGNWVKERLVPTLGPVRVIDVAPSPLAAARWGTDGVVEMVGYPSDIPMAMRSIARSCPCLPCRWCAELICGARCPFCSMAQYDQPVGPRA